MNSSIQAKLRALEVEFLHGVPVHLPKSSITEILAIIDREKAKAVREARIDQMNYVDQRLIGKNTSGDRVFYDKDAVIAENRLLDRQRVIWNAMVAELESSLTKGEADDTASSE